jgi:SynChlorMet cassette radical SAM/SPASM protein ScmF
MDNSQAFNIPLQRLYFYLTGNCNLRCRHCWIAPRYVADAQETSLYLDIALFKTVIEQAKPLGLASVKLTGGEPILHPNFFELLEFIKKNDIVLSIETNGTLCDERLANAIRSCKQPFVSVSLDGANPESHEFVRGVEGSFNQALKGLGHLVNAGLKTQIIMSVMSHNKNELADIVHLAETIGVGSVKFNLIQPTSRGKTMHDSGQVPTIEELVALGKWVETELRPSTKLRLFYSHPLAFRPLNRIFEGDGSGSSTCGILTALGVLSDGSYALCGIGSVLKEFIFGNIQHDDLKTLWERHPILLELRNGIATQLTGICGKCVMQKMCKGNCIAQNYYSSHSLWAPFWFCQQAYEKGIFPSSRMTSEAVQS